MAMKKLMIYIMSFFNLLFFGCEEEIIKPTNNFKTYVEGEIVVGLKKDLSFEEFIDTVFAVNEIYGIEVSNINYSSDLPENERNFLEECLSSYGFIDRYTTLKYNSDENRWEIEFWISGFTKRNVNDWSDIIRKLKLKHVPNNFQNILLRIAPGKEKEWIKKLNELQIFRYVEENYIIREF